ncbi:FtsK/SpoIIIE domain-containing protein [Micromonospora sp. C28SCA-DRY-2]|uniref:FtsK/SpoIIIE domain-containing protein n=1 Tax=Micromonospora sp. C28SCA-DRY-2 TaxID=3059522 RepID=UPI002675468E|nr:FtsK/SpoIIIE domain-containing protein [Micromonospora sp. C28SCA-DRY-2]MDO3703687.1 FtsK/SpoIIIE domain-containing protein [Micromonospora sp. C28SCA-DRY-2]
MAGPKARTNRAAALHRRAAATATAAAAALDETRPAPADQRRQYELAERLRNAAALLAPGWAGAPLETLTPTAPAGEGPPPFVRVGTAAPLDDARFPALVPLLGTGHLSVDVDAHEPRVAGLLRAVLLRLLAATPAGALLVRAVDAAGGTLASFAPLADAGLLPPPVSDVAGLRAVLNEAEQWVAPGASGRRRHDRTLLLVLAALPESTGATDLARIAALAEQGPSAGLHLLVAGWPRPGRDALPLATPLAMRTAYALLGDPPGTSFAGPGAERPGGLNSPVFVETDPPADLVDAVCRRLAEQVEAGSRLALADLLPADDAELWTAGSADGLGTTVGDAGGRPVSLGFTELTPHWLVSGRSGTGRSTFLTTALLGLAARYGPDELTLYLVDLGDGESFVEFLQTERDRSWIPQVRAAALAADREYVLDLLDGLTAELHRREEAGSRAGGQRYAELRQHQLLPRIVCVLDNLPLLFAERDRLAVDAAARLEALARGGRSYGIHLVLAGEGDLGLGSRTDGGHRDSMLGQFPVRVALPGGGAVLEPTNDSAAGLPVGSAVVNTAGGLGGPRGAIRGHERMVRFPDPQDDPETVERLRHRLWSARPEGSGPPVVFAGYARPRLRNDPRHRTALAGRAHGPAALLGRAVEVARTTVAVPLGPAAGRNLAVLGPGPEAAALLATAARSTAAHHPQGAARFVLAADDATPAIDALAAELAARHPVERVGLPGLLAVADAGEPAYLVAFGVDAGQRLPADRLRTLLREGPPAGLHVLGWWRAVPPFAALLEPADGEVDKLAAVAVVDVPGSQLAPVFGRPVDWRPRPGRAVLWDGPGERGTVLIPFASEGVG